MRTPVALFAFNRVDTLARVFAAVRAARPSRLFLVCDGPRADRPDDVARCGEVRRLLEQVDWPCEVERNYADSNMGCRTRIPSGVDWVFSRTDEAIFLEDDTLPDATFFPFCDELLARYRHDERVLMISAYNVLESAVRGDSYWFSAHPRIWGWASWRHAWTGYDVAMSEWPALRTTNAWTDRTPAEQAAWGPFLDAVKAGAVDTWDAQLTLHAWRTRRLCVIPATNLMTNLGFGAESTNTTAAAFPGPAVRPLPSPLVHPAMVQRAERLDAAWLAQERAPRRGAWRSAVPRGVRWMARRVLNWLAGR